MENQNSPVAGMEPVLAEIQEHLQKHPMEWLKSLRQDPNGLAKLDQEIHRAFAHMADRMVAGLVAAMADVPGGAKK
jgi:hypothetical protein